MGSLQGSLEVEELGATTYGQTLKVDYSPYIPSILYQKAWGGSSTDYGSGVAEDPDGSIYLMGESYSFCCGSPSAFVLKLDQARNPVWQLNLWGDEYFNRYGHAGGVTASQTGTIYMTGYYDNSSTANDIFILALNSTGNLLWGRTWNGAGDDYGASDDYGRAVALDSDGNIYVTGATSILGTLSLLLLKLRSNGTVLWLRTWSAAFDVSPKSLAIDPSGHIYIAGNILTIGTGRMYPAAFLIKFSAEGDLLWKRFWGRNSYNSANAVAIDSSGNPVVTGYVNNFFEGSGTPGIPLLKFDSTGTLLWEVLWPVSFGSGSGLTVDTAGDIYLVGSSPGLLLGKFDSTGVLDWGVSAGSSSDSGAGISADQAGNLLVVGSVNQNPSTTIIPFLYKVINPSFTFFSIDGVMRTSGANATNLYATVGYSPVSGNPGYSGGTDAYLLKVRSPTAIAPSPPYALVAQAGDSNVTLSWTAPDFNGGSAVTGYRVYRGDSNGTETPYVNTTSNLSYTDKAVTPGYTYFYYVRAVNSEGESGPSNRARASLPGSFQFEFLQPASIAAIVGGIAVVSLAVIVRRRSSRV